MIDDRPPIDLPQLIEILGDEDEPSLLHIMDIFLKYAPTMLEAIDNALAAEDRTLIQEGAHAFKGAAAQAAARPLAEILHELERSARSSGLADLQKLTGCARDELARVAAFRRERD